MPQLTELRIRLDQMTERIVSRLKDRSRFPLNEPVYLRDAVPITGRSGISLLEFALEGLETYHASLGRFAYPDQFPLVSSHPPESPVARIVGQPELPPLQITIASDLLRFYRQLLPELCRPGDDPSTHGETVYVDADLLELLHERIHIGRSVAQAKLDADSSILSPSLDDVALAARLRDAQREEALIASVRAVAARYELPPGVAERVFRWVIEETLLVEVSYLRQLSSSR